jgi:hypothetical protein
VRVRRLDDLQLTTSASSRPTSGRELAVLHGAAGTLKRNRPALLIEAEERHEHTTPCSAISEFLAGLRYTGYFDMGGVGRQ